MFLADFRTKEAGSSLEEGVQGGRRILEGRSRIGSLESITQVPCV